MIAFSVLQIYLVNVLKSFLQFLCDILDIPDEPFHNEDQAIVELYVVHERRATVFKAPKLWKGRSGWPRIRQLLIHTG